MSRASMSLRRTLSVEQRRFLREVTLGVGRATSRLRMLPSFLVVGAQRCGTTTLYRMLCEHPQIVRPAFTKGIGYFDLHYDRGPAWYRSHFPIRASTKARTRAAGITFESSGYYLYHPLAAERIALDLPEVKIVAVVRDPVERAFSAHAHEFARGFETEPFDRALELEPQRIFGEVERMRNDPGYQSYAHRHHSYLARGRYAAQLQPYLDLLGPAQVRVVDFGDLFSHPDDEFRKITEWLGLSEWTPTRVSKHNARPAGLEMDGTLRARLEDGFAEQDRRLAEIMGRTPSWRR